MSGNDELFMQWHERQCRASLLTFELSPAFIPMAAFGLSIDPLGPALVCTAVNEDNLEELDLADTPGTWRTPLLSPFSLYPRGVDIVSFSAAADVITPDGVAEALIVFTFDDERGRTTIWHDTDEPPVLEADDTSPEGKMGDVVVMLRSYREFVKQHPEAQQGGTWNGEDYPYFALARHLLNEGVIGMATVRSDLVPDEEAEGGLTHEI